MFISPFLFLSQCIQILVLFFLNLLKVRLVYELALSQDFFFNTSDKRLHTSCVVYFKAWHCEMTRKNILHENLYDASSPLHSTVLVQFCQRNVQYTWPILRVQETCLNTLTWSRARHPHATPTPPPCSSKNVDREERRSVKCPRCPSESWILWGLNRLLISDPSPGN